MTIIYYYLLSSATATIYYCYHLLLLSSIIVTAYKIDFLAVSELKVMEVKTKLDDFISSYYPIVWMDDNVKMLINSIEEDDWEEMINACLRIEKSMSVTLYTTFLAILQHDYLYEKYGRCISPYSWWYSGIVTEAIELSLLYQRITGEQRQMIIDFLTVNNHLINSKYSNTTGIVAQSSNDNNNGGQKQLPSNHQIGCKLRSKAPLARVREQLTITCDRINWMVDRYEETNNREVASKSPIPNDTLFAVLIEMWKKLDKH